MNKLLPRGHTHTTHTQISQTRLFYSHAFSTHCLPLFTRHLWSKVNLAVSQDLCFICHVIKERAAAKLTLMDV